MEAIESFAAHTPFGAALILQIMVGLATLAFLGVCETLLGTRPPIRAWIISSVASVSLYGLNVVLVAFPLLLLKSLQALWQQVGLPTVPAAFWTAWPTWATALLSLILRDFVDYWTHRAMHTKWLWPFHAVHHSDPVLSPATSWRVHFLECVTMQVSYIILLTGLGLPKLPICLSQLAIPILNFYIHTNVKWGHGPFRAFVASPHFHQWHHANQPAAYGKNLANVFPLFDLIFGTYYDPGPCTDRFGVDGVPTHNVVDLMLHPFKAWLQMIQARRL